MSSEELLLREKIPKYLLGCHKQAQWDALLQKHNLVVVSFITCNSPSMELTDNMKCLAAEFEIVKFFEVDVNYFKPKDKNFKVTKVPSVMFVNNGVRKFNEFSDHLNADKLKKKISELCI